MTKNPSGSNSGHALRRLALKNLGGRKAYSGVIIAAAAAAAAMALFVFFMTQGVQQGLENNRRMLGPDLALAPKGTKARGQIYLSKGVPLGAVPAATAELSGRFSEVAAVTVQRRLDSVSGDKGEITLIGFDPYTDFMVLPWLDKGAAELARSGQSGLILGARVEALPEFVALPGMENIGVTGRLKESGTFMDKSIFIPWPVENILLAPSWVLIRLRQGVSLDMAANRLEVNLEGTEVLLRPEMFKIINDHLYGLLLGGGFDAAALLVILGALSALGAMFALMTHERKRELGLLKALGAGNSFIFSLILSEAALLGALGGTLGGVIILVWLALASPGEFSPPFILLGFGVAAGASGLTGMVAALLPAVLATRMEPYAAIRSGE